MIDPQNIVRYNRNRPQLEELALFCVAVAGKKASTIAPALNELLKTLRSGYNTKLCMVAGYWEDNKKPSPFELIRYANSTSFGPFSLATAIKHHGIGCYTQKAETFTELATSDLDLKTCTVEDLEKIKGIGPKTSRFFLMSSRPNVRYAALDTHILRWMRDQNVENVPKSTPTGKKYLTLEQTYLKMVPENMSPAEWDLEIWKKYSSKKV